jgi:hypothetical protein
MAKKVLVGAKIFLGRLVVGKVLVHPKSFNLPQ